MLADTTATAELPQLHLPQDLLTEVSRRGTKAKADYYGIESMKPSLFGRLVEKLIGKSGR